MNNRTVKPSLIRRMLCALGLHGPHWRGPNSYPDSCRTAGFERTCTFCGQKWYGAEVERNNMRMLGDWATKEQLIKRGEWKV